VPTYWDSWTVVWREIYSSVLRVYRLFAQCSIRAGVSDDSRCLWAFMGKFAPVHEMAVLTTRARIRIGVRAGSSMRLVRLKSHGPGPVGAGTSHTSSAESVSLNLRMWARPGPPGTTKIYKVGLGPLWVPKFLKRKFAVFWNFCKVSSRSVQPFCHNSHNISKQRR